MNKEEYKFDHFKNIDEVMYYLNYWYKEEDVYSIDRYLSLKDFNYISNKYQELQQQNKRQKEVIDKSIDFIKNGDLLYLANKNSIVHRNNIEIRVVADRLNDLLQILEDKEVSE